jgi:hypothetical protein
MGWEEIDDDSHAKVGRQEVVLRCVERKHGKRHAPIYCVLFYFGEAILQALGWQESTIVKLVWGSGPQKGFIRLTPMAPGGKGWDVKIRKSGFALVQTKVFPLNVNKIVRELSVSFDHAQVSGSDLSFIDLELPDDFYIKDTEVQTNVKRKNLIKDEEKGILAPKPAATLVQVKRTAFAPDRDEYTVDAEELCAYIRTDLGKKAHVESSRTLNINGQTCTLDRALTVLNENRAMFNLKPLSFVA